MIDPAVAAEATRRRTFAIISHPDAGKTTLTEKLLLLGGAIHLAGEVKAKGERRRARSDWMAIEQQRGISVTTSAMTFEHAGCVLNLLDTPGHEDFSEDTYRTLTAVDSAIMVLDAAKGIEAQTLKLFEVCRLRDVPIVTFVNKLDRESLDPFALLDEIHDRLALDVAPMLWPVGMGQNFRGCAIRGTRELLYFDPDAGPVPERRLKRGTSELFERVPAEQLQLLDEQMELVDGALPSFEETAYREGHLTPVFFGSALKTFGVRALLDFLSAHAPSPRPQPAAERAVEPGEPQVTGFVFKVQANMDKAHRDRIAFVRVCSGTFQRGTVVTHGRTGKPFNTKYAHQVFGQERETLEEAYPGDVVGLVNATDVRVGDTLYVDPPVTFPPIPTFAPEHFRVARVRDTSKFKQFRRGITQLDEEGVVQVLRDRELGDQAPVLAAVGPMQFDVATWRLENEFGAPVELNPTAYTVARRTDAASAERLRSMSGVRILQRADGDLYALFESQYWVARLEQDHPDLVLERLVAEGRPG